MWLMWLFCGTGSRYTLWISRLGLQAETLEGLEMTKTKKKCLHRRRRGYDGVMRRD